MYWILIIKAHSPLTWCTWLTMQPLRFTYTAGLQESPYNAAYLLGIFGRSHSLASSMKMQPSADVAKSSVSSDPMRSRSTAVPKHLYSWNSPVSGSL